MQKKHQNMRDLIGDVINYCASFYYAKIVYVVIS